MQIIPVNIKYFIILALAGSMATCSSYAGTIIGQLQSPSGLPVKEGVLELQLQQAGVIAGIGSIAPLAASCYTSEDGSVVGMPDPQEIPVDSVDPASGSLPAGIYYIETTFYSGSEETRPSPELRVQLTGAGMVTINPPASFPANAAGIKIYIGTAAGGEELQGETTSRTTQYSQSIPLVSGAAPPIANDSVCTIAFNDTIIPYSGYNVSLVSSAGNAYPGWPQAWQLNGGPNGVVDISSGAPLWNGTVIYPQPIFAQPLDHGPQSIAGPLGMSGYNIFGVGYLGVGTNTPGWGVDVEGTSGINSASGYLFNGSAPLNHMLLGNGNYYVDSATIPASGISGLFYQTVLSNGTAEPQEVNLSFSSRFALTDNSGNNTEVDLAKSGVAAGTYTDATVTFDQFGRATSASNGPTIHETQVLVITSGICTTAAAAYASCNTVYNWPSAWTDTNYAVTCSAVPSGQFMTAVWADNKTTTSIDVYLQNGDASGANAVTANEIDCIGSHL